MITQSKKEAVTSKCTSITGHFDGHADALKRYMQHHPMQHGQGYTGSHCTPPSGNYLLCIASAAARVTANKASIKNVPTLMALLMAMAVQCYNTVRITRWRRLMAFLMATKRRHWVSTCSDNMNRTCPPQFIVVHFIVKSSKMLLSQYNDS